MVEKRLVSFAKKTVTNVISGEDFELPEGLKKKYSQKDGVFLKMYVAGELRGSSQIPIGVYKTFEAVKEAAITAAFNDPTSTPISEDELSDLDFEISILSKPSPIKGLNSVDIKKNGIMIRKQNFNAMILPDEIKEEEMDVKEAVEMCCMKAGLTPDSWKKDNCEVFKFDVKTTN